VRKLSQWLELHDSDLVAINGVGDDVIVELHGYIHAWERHDDRWAGTGSTQSVSIRVMGGQPARAAVGETVRLSGGTLDVGSVFENLVPIPLASSHATRLRLCLVTGETLEFTGHSVHVAAHGDAVFVEHLPDHLRPDV
jgi:hypothetical protein